jgi:acetoin utilization deacetylase AcuC-like enzyme
MKGKNTALIWKEEFLKHDTGLHPEKIERLVAIRSYLEKTSYYNDLVRPDFKPATWEKIAQNHDGRYVQGLENICQQKKSGNLDPDTPFSSGTYEAASLAAGAGMKLAEMVWKGEVSNGVALVRPPGHHSVYETAMGFCFFNNIAIAARHLKTLGAQRILILDWDVHHGNGTESSFYEDDSVYFVSLHQYPFYPGTGKESDRGKGKGLGYTLNCPLPRGSGEADYKTVYEEKVFPALDAFQPEIILISAGFDAHKRDPLGGMELETESFAKFTEWTLKKAKEHCQGKIVSFLEGGYDLTALSESVEAHVSVLADS